MQNIDLKITVDEWKKETIFQESFHLYVKEEFLRSQEPKKHNIYNHTHRFKEKIKKNQQQEIRFLCVKRSLYYVDYGINVGTEINGVRPSLIYKDSEFGFGEDIIAFPMTSYEESKSLDTFDVVIESDATNKLKQTSIIKIRQIRCISKKRLQKYIGKITDKTAKNQVQGNVLRMFGVR